MAASDDFHVEIKRIRKEDNIETTQKLEFCDVDELVHNPGLQHVALYIFNLMDFYTLKTCRAISKSWKRMIDNDKHWWRLLLFKCTEINAGTRNFRPVIFTGSFEDPDIFVGPSFQVAMKPLNQLHPMFVDTFAYICDMETLETLEMFTKFMIDYFKTLKVKNLGSPLHYASSLKRLDIFEVMSRTPILDLNLEGLTFSGDQVLNEDDDDKESGVTVLHYACMKDHVETVEYFMSLKGPRKIDFSAPIKGNTLFHEACRYDSENVVKLFLNKADQLGINLNSPNERGTTPFMMLGSPNLLKLFLEDERIDVNARDETGYTALFQLFLLVKIKESTLENIKILLDSPRIDLSMLYLDNYLPLHVASYNPHVSQDIPRVELFLKSAINKGIDVNQRDGKGLTPVHYAFGYLHANMNLQTNYNLKKFSPMAEVFMKYAQDLSINFEATDNQGRTPLHYMFQARSKSEVLAFIEVAKHDYNIEFDLKVRDHTGLTPIELSKSD